MKGGKSLLVPILWMSSKADIRVGTPQRTSMFYPRKKNNGLCLLSFFSPGYTAYLCLATAVVSVSTRSFFLPAATYKWQSSINLLIVEKSFLRSSTVTTEGLNGV